MTDDDCKRYFKDVADLTSAVQASSGTLGLGRGQHDKARSLALLKKMAEKCDHTTREYDSGCWSTVDDNGDKIAFKRLGKAQDIVAVVHEPSRSIWWGQAQPSTHLVAIKPKESIKPKE